MLIEIKSNNRNAITCLKLLGVYKVRKLKTKHFQWTASKVENCKQNQYVTTVRVHVHLSVSVVNSVESCLNYVWESLPVFHIFNHFRHYLFCYLVSLVVPLICPMSVYDKNIKLMQIHIIFTDQSYLNTNL